MSVGIISVNTIAPIGARPQPGRHMTSFNVLKASNEQTKYIRWTGIFAWFADAEWTNGTQQQWQIDGLAQDCSISIANALELLQSCAKPPK